MTMSPVARHRARYVVPLAAAVITAGVVFIPQAASGAQHPTLPARTAAQLLASLEQANMPEFSGTTVETARLGLPSLNDVSLPGGGSLDDGSILGQAVTLLTGSHTAQIAYGGPDRQRVAIFLSDLSETDVVHNGTDLWTYNSDTNSVTHKTLKADQSDAQGSQQTTPVDPTKAAEHALAKIDPSTQVTVDRTAEVAGRPAYQLVLTPRDARTLIGSVRIAIDSATSMPLRVEVWSRNDAGKPAFSVGFTSISMKAPGTSTFDFTKPPTARTEKFSLEGPGSPKASGAAQDSRSPDRSATFGKDWTSVYEESLGSDARPDAQPARSISGAQPGPKSGPPSGPPSGPSLTQTLDQLATTVPAGHLLTTSLVTVLITNDNRLLVGAVTPQYIEQLATSGAAQ